VAEPKEPDPVLLVVAVFSRWLEAIDWSRDRLQNRYGPILRPSTVFDFVETDYYNDEMGIGLKKQFFAFERLIRPDELASIKLATNEIEKHAASADDWSLARTGVARPVNLDPGYLHSGKWVLATTKDQSHRVYLGQGIYGEVTLRFERGEYVPWPWTYPNYCRRDYREFFAQIRSDYLKLLKPVACRSSAS
jgi:hypothetical protein